MDRILETPLQKLIKRGNIKTIQENDLLVDAIKQMEDMEVSALLVANDQGQHVGVLSRTDIASNKLVKVLEFRKIENVLVRELMNKNTPVCLNQNEPLIQAISVMHKRHFHRVFVVDDDKHLCGLISSSDILKILVVESPHLFAESNKEAQQQHFENMKRRHEAYMEDISWD